MLLLITRNTCCQDCVNCKGQLEFCCKGVAEMTCTVGHHLQDYRDEVTKGTRSFLHPAASMVRFLQVPRPRDQFFEPQPARKSRTSSPGLNTTAGAVFADSAILWLISSNSDFTQPTLDTSISPFCVIQKTVGTLVNP